MKIENSDLISKAIYDIQITCQHIVNFYSSEKAKTLAKKQLSAKYSKDCLAVALNQVFTI